jgi:hypothetical protein
MFNRALRSYEVHAGRSPDVCLPSTFFGVPCTFSRQADPLFIAARTAATVARRAADAGAGTPATAPPGLYTYDHDKRRFAITTPTYSAAVVDQTFATGYGGVGLARLYDADGNPLGSIGGRGRAGFGLTVLRRPGSVLLETLPGGRAGRSFHGPTAKRASLSGPVSVTATVAGALGTRVAVRHSFTSRTITTRYEVRGAHARTAVIALPVWSRSTPPVRPTVTVRGRALTVAVRQPVSGYTATVRGGGPWRTVWRRSARRSSRSPGTAARLDVVVPLRAGRATVTVMLRPQSLQRPGS